MDTWNTYCGQSHTESALSLAHVYIGGLSLWLIANIRDREGDAISPCGTCHERFLARSQSGQLRADVLLEGGEASA